MSTLYHNKYQQKQQKLTIFGNKRTYTLSPFQRTDMTLHIMLKFQWEAESTWDSILIMILVNRCYRSPCAENIHQHLKSLDEEQQSDSNIFIALTIRSLDCNKIFSSDRRNSAIQKTRMHHATDGR